MSRPRLLDLFCKAGGCAKGYQRAGFYVVGVDKDPQPRYCGDEFVQSDAIEYVREHGHEFDAIHASPPCQKFSRVSGRSRKAKKRVYPDLVDATRQALKATGRPYVIENVEGAPLAGITLCGRTFGLAVYRHRLFESSEFLMQPPHAKHNVVIGAGRMLNDRKKGSLNNGSAKGAWGGQQIVTVAGGQFKKSDGERAMGIDWMTKYGLAQAIPPAYTEFIGRQLLNYLQR
ncbi:MAG: DNA cytosine methyltransferase [Armatimonadota bacterium]